MINTIMEEYEDNMTGNFIKKRFLRYLIHNFRMKILNRNFIVKTLIISYS